MSKNTPPTTTRAAIVNCGPDTPAAIKFLTLWAPKGPWVLTAIEPERRGIDTQTFRPADGEKLAAWLKRYNGHRNIYFHVNPVLHDLTKKAEREDVAAMAWLHVDIDARPSEDLATEQGRILGVLREPPGDIPPPTIIIFSGGGYQGFWKLEEPFHIGGDLAKAEEAARYNMSIELALEGDNCHNVDRIMRLPGTVNIPGSKKRAKGRVEALAELVEHHPDRVYPLDRFKPAPAVQTGGAGGLEGTAGRPVEIPANFERLQGIDDLDQWDVPDRTRIIIMQGHHPEEGPKERDDSRSIWLFDVVCSLVRCEVPDDTIFSVITDPEFDISKSVLDKGPNAEKYAARQIERGRKFTAADEDDFDRSDKGVPYKQSQRNIRLALPKLGIEVEHDTFQDRLLIAGLEGVGPLLDDRAMTRLWLLVDERFRFRPAKEFFWMVVEDTGRRAPFHPVVEYLAGLAWDGKSRIDHWLETYAGAEDTPYIRAVGALMLIAAVHRVRQPGCKFDEMPVLEAEQGTNKSSALAILAVKEDWFSDDLPLNVDSKRVIENLAGRWIVEAAELKGMRKGDVEHLKAFLSRRLDRARMSYDRLISEVPRQCIIVGTTNSSYYLRDGTGNRRFWPVKVSKFELDALRRDRDQLWAEAAHREAAGESIRLDPALYADAAAEQDLRRVEDPFAQTLAETLGDLNGKIATSDVWLIIDVPTGQRSQDDNSRLGEAMRELGWERKRLRIDKKPNWCYVRGEGAEREKRITIHRDPNGHVSARTGTPLPNDPF